MNLENLISKYIDGELTLEEDGKLRSIISEDEFAKEKFDNSVSLHLAFREDANSIRTPEELLRKTEDKILMEILNEPPVAFTRVKEKTRIPALVTLVTILIIFTIFRISDSNFFSSLPLISYDYEKSDKNINTEQKSELYSKDNNDKNLTLINKEKINRKYEAVTKKHNSIDNSGTLVSNDNSNANIPFSSTKSSQISSPEIKDDMIAQNVVSNNILPDEVPAFSEIPAEDITKEIMNENLLHMQNKLQVDIPFQDNKFPTQRTSVPGILNLNEFDFVNNNSEVQLTSFFGSDFARYGIEQKSKTLVSNFSQSIAYNLDGTNKIGLEIGYSDYEYNELVNIRIPVRSSTNTKDESNLLVVNPIRADNNYLSTTMQLERQKRMFWGAAFYEINIINFENFLLSGRLGIGGSNEGPLSYSRIYAKQRIVYGIFLTVGCDGRFFYTYMPKYASDKRELKGTLSLIYGLQFKF